MNSEQMFKSAKLATYRQIKAKNKKFKMSEMRHMTPENTAPYLALCEKYGLNPFEGYSMWSANMPVFKLQNRKTR